MLTAEDMPGMCRPEQWARLIALRDAKVSLETDTAQLKNTVQLLTDQLAVLQEEEALLEAKITAAEQVLHTPSVHTLVVACHHKLWHSTTLPMTSIHTSI